MIIIKKIVVMLFMFLVGVAAHSAKIELVEETTLSNKFLLRFILSFGVTEHEDYILPDLMASNIKLYDSRGDAISVFGRPGRGPNELGKPTYCKYSSNQLYFHDGELGKILFYKRKGKKLARFHEIEHLGLLHDLLYIDDKVYVAGFKTTENKNYYDFFYYDKDGRCTFLIPSHIKYGLKSKKVFEREYFRGDLPQYGLQASFDIHGDYAYMVWSADLRIIRINLKTRDIITFGHKTSHYRKPYVNEKIMIARAQRNGKILTRERNKMSYVWKVLATKKHVMVVYKPIKMDEMMMQFYTPEGKFLGEKIIPKGTSSRMVYHKSSDNLYILTRETVGEDTDDIDDRYIVLKYKIHF